MEKIITKLVVVDGISIAALSQSE